MSQAFRCDGLDTPQAYISNKKNFPKNWAVEIKGLGPNSPFWVPGDPLGASYQAKKSGDHMFNLCRPLGCSWDQIWPIGALRGPRGPPKGPFGAKLSPFRAPSGPERAGYQVKVCVDHESNSGGPMGGRWDQIWLPAALRGPPGPPKGSFGAKMSPFGGRRGPLRGPSAWYGCVRPRRTVWKCF